VSTRTQNKHLLPPPQPGEVRNPAGRPKGSRNKLGEAFIAAIHDDFLLYGFKAIARVREEDPVAYVKVCAALLPREVKVETVSDLSDEELDRRLRHTIRDLACSSGWSLGLPEDEPIQ
jgi:hypothetical protein